MKKHSNTLFSSLQKKEISNLTTEVKETIAFGLVEPGSKIFTVAELWNIQRNVKARMQRRYL